jgi:hypothetical protein
MICLSLMLVSCDPEDLVNTYFEQMGLTRLAVLRTDVQPGTIILMKGNEAFLSDTVFEYIDSEVDSSQTFAMLAGSADKEIAARLPHFSGRTQLSGKMAVQFIASLFHLGPQVDLDLAGQVNVRIPDMKVRKMKIAHLEHFFKDEEAERFAQKVRTWIRQGLQPYVAYEVFRAKTIQISSTKGQDVAPSLKAETVARLPVSGEVGVHYKKTSKTELVVASQRYFAFAVKTARLRWDRKEEMVVPDITQRAKPSGEGAKGGPDDEYAAPLVKGFQPVTLQSGLPPEF